MFMDSALWLHLRRNWRPLYSERYEFGITFHESSVSPSKLLIHAKRNNFTIGVKLIKLVHLLQGLIYNCSLFYFFCFSIGKRRFVSRQF